MVEFLAQFRNQLYEKLHLYNWADCGMDLIDALASAQGVRSVVELSLQPAFRNRHPSGLFKAIRFFPLSGQEMMALFAPYLPLPQQRPFRLLAVDTLPHPRPFAECLEDRGYIYAPNPTPGQKPIAIGHTCSLLAFLPEREDELLGPSLGCLPGCPAGCHQPERCPGGPEADRPVASDPGPGQPLLEGRSRPWSSPTAATAHRPLSFPW